MKTNLDVLKEIGYELNRFQKKIALAVKEQTENGDTGSGNRDYAACRRAALDLKKELTKLTQDSIYKYQK